MVNWWARLSTSRYMVELCLVDSLADFLAVDVQESLISCQGYGSVLR